MHQYRRRCAELHTLRPCFGVLCDLHAACARYAIGDGSREPSADSLGTCAADPGCADRPGFIDVRFIGPPPPRQYALTRYRPGRPDFAARAPCAGD